MYRLKFGVLLVVVMLVGCVKIPIGDGNSLKFSKDGITVTDKDGTDTEVTYDEDNISVSTGDGEEGFNLSGGANAELPEGFPEEIPLTDDANIMQAAEQTEDSTKYYIITYFTEQPMEDVIQMYHAYIDDSGFEEVEASKEMEQLYDGEMIQTMRGEEESFSVSILFDDDSEEDIVTVTISYANAKE